MEKAKKPIVQDQPAYQPDMATRERQWKIQAERAANDRLRGLCLAHPDVADLVRENASLREQLAKATGKAPKPPKPPASTKVAAPEKVEPVPDAPPAAAESAPVEGEVNSAEDDSDDFDMKPGTRVRRNP